MSPGLLTKMKKFYSPEQAPVGWRSTARSGKNRQEFQELTEHYRRTKNIACFFRDHTRSPHWGCRGTKRRVSDLHAMQHVVNAVLPRRQAGNCTAGKALRHCWLRRNSTSSGTLSVAMTSTSARISSFHAFGKSGVAQNLNFLPWLWAVFINSDIVARA